MLKLKTEPDPDGTGTQTGRTTETVYDDAGKVVATRYNTDPWTCTTYDSRERVAETDIPAYNGEAARTVQNDYAVGGNPLETTSWDGNGWIVTWSDLLGRTTKYRDVHDDETTSTYDNQGRLTQRVSPLGTETFVYDNVDRLTDQKLDGTTYAHITYDQYSRIDTVTYPAAGQLKLQLSRDTLGRTSANTYTLGNGTTQVADTVTRAVTDDITTDVVSSGSNSLWYTYGYDTAGRLTNAAIGPHTYSYSYGTESSSCNSVAGNNVNAGKDSNRTSQTIDGTTTTFRYDQADRLQSSSNVLYNGGDYDTHDNTTSVGTGTTPLRLCYDSSDRNTCMTQRDANGNGQATYYSRDVQGRIVYRENDSITNWNWATTGQYWYGFTGSGDTPDYVKNSSGTVTEKYLQLPGGVLMTIKPPQTGNAQKMYSLPNIHGDTLLTTDAAGTNTSTGNGPSSTFTYDPFGNILPGSTLPASSIGNASFGYVGTNEKITEAAYTLTPIQMGARVYIPGLGRFLQVDPQQGGTDNNYVYATDPVNDFDLDGNISWKGVANLASWASMVPGPIGMTAAGVSVVAYAAAGDKKAAILACATIAAAAVGAGVGVTAFKASKIANAAKAGEDLGKFGKVNKVTSNLAGKMYVGKGAQKIPIKAGYRLVSNDGMRAYRGPAFKAKDNRFQSNFEAFKTRPTSNKKFKAPNRYYNGHLDIRR